MINVLIVDDEKHACDRLAELVTEIPGCHVKACSQDGLDAVEKVDAMDIDVVLMDIHMPVMDGLEAARHMNKIADSPQIIFTTAYRQHALAAFGVNAQGFLLKPIMRHQLREKLNSLPRHNINACVREPMPGTPRSHIYCRVANQLELIAVEDIIYFKSEQKYTAVKHVNGSHLIEEALKYLEREFGDILMRVHRGALVNKHYIQCLESDDNKRVWLGLKGTSDTLLISRRYISEARTYVRRFSSSEVDAAAGS